MRFFHYYLDTKENNIEFKKIMSRFKIGYSHKKINLFDKKYMFVLIDGDRAEYFQKLISLEEFSFRIHGMFDIFVYDPNLDNTPPSLPNLIVN
jgi:hypothetical protein